MTAPTMIPVRSIAEIRNERARRSILRVMGHEGADTLHYDALAEAMRDANTLSDEAGDLAASIVMSSADPFTAIRVQTILDTETPDEALSTLSHLFNRLVEGHERGIGICPSGVELTIGGAA